MSDDYLSTARSLLRQQPVDGFRIVNASKHRKLIINYSGKTQFIIFPTSASDWRGVRNFKAEICRALRALEVPRPHHEPRVGPVRRNRCKPQRSAPCQLEKAPIQKDWKAGLVEASIHLFGGVPGTEESWKGR